MRKGMILDILFSRPSYYAKMHAPNPIGLTKKIILCILIFFSFFLCSISFDIKKQDETRADDLLIEFLMLSPDEIDLYTIKIFANGQYLCRYGEMFEGEGEIRFKKISSEKKITLKPEQFKILKKIISEIDEAEISKKINIGWKDTWTIIISFNKISLTMSDGEIYYRKGTILKLFEYVLTLSPIRIELYGVV